MKKMIFVFMAVLLFAATSAPAVVDAKPRAFKSGKQSFSKTTTKNQDNNVSKADTNKTSTTNSTGGTTANRGFFSGGSLMKGLMIGGLAGLLFGGLFSNLGFMGDFLGLLVNVLAIYLLFIVGRSIFQYVKEQRRLKEEQHKRY